MAHTRKKECLVPALEAVSGRPSPGTARQDVHGTWVLHELMLKSISEPKGMDDLVIGPTSAVVSLCAQYEVMVLGLCEEEQGPVQDARQIHEP